MFFNVYLGIYEDRHYIGTVFTTESKLEELRVESLKDEDTDRWVSYEPVRDFTNYDALLRSLKTECAPIDWEDWDEVDEEYDDYE